MQLWCCFQQQKLKLRQSFSDEPDTLRIQEWYVNGLLHEMLQDILLHCQYLKASRRVCGCFQLNQML